MSCFHPLKGWFSRERNASGKRSITFDRMKAYSDLRVQIPCGQCVGCRLDRAKSWAIRCMHEAKFHEQSCFLTLTYKEIPKGGSLNKVDFQRFMKRLRIWRSRYDKGSGRRDLRYYMCGEYGEQFSRPHYHVLLFGFNFSDRRLCSTRGSVRLYRSGLLEKLWTHGICRIGDVSFESAAYVARYVQKKITGDAAASHYCGKESEFNLMSRRPGIARKWIEKYSSSVYPHDFVTMQNGMRLRPPKYYDYVYDLTDSELMGNIKAERVKKLRDSPDATPERLQAREAILRLKMARLKRGVEDGSSCVHSSR